MKHKIFPKEIVRFSLESHYFRFSRHSKIIYLLVIGFIVASLVSLPYLKTDISVQSRGIIRSLTEPTTIQTPVTGQVEEIRIRENMKVSAGDTLIKLSRGKIDDQVKILGDKIALYSAYINDLENLSKGKNQTLQSELIRSNLAEFQQKQNEYKLQIETTQKDYNRAKTLFEKQVIAPADFEKKELELNQLVKERDFYISQKKTEWHQQLFQYRTELQTLTDNLEQLKFEERFYAATAPVSGYISNFNGVRAGSFIFPNQTIATISPSDSLIVECYVTPGDIGYLQTGNPAKFQIDAYNYNQWGLASGKIIDISNQPYQENNTVYFKVKCKLDQNFLSLKSGHRGKFKNGLTLTSRFFITRRSLYELLFDKADNWLNPRILAVKK